MKKLFAVLTLLVSLNTFANCPLDFKETNLCASLKWINGPVLNKRSHFQVSFWKKGDSENTEVSPEYDVKIYPWMVMANGHNHGGPKMTVSEIQPGVFEVKDARFFMHGMKGHWEVHIDLLAENGFVHSKSKVTVDFDGSFESEHEHGH